MQASIWTSGTLFLSHEGHHDQIDQHKPMARLTSLRRRDTARLQGIDEDDACIIGEAEHENRMDDCRSWFLQCCATELEAWEAVSVPVMPWP